MKICHLSILHFRFDVRILVKQCTSLHQAGYEVHLLVADGLGDEIRNGIQIHDAGLRPPRTLHRITSFQQQFLKKALEIDAHLYHFHDPELMYLGLQLKRQGKRVIMDVHEDVPRQIISKKTNFRNRALGRLIESLEKYTTPRFDAVITASPLLQKRFDSYGGRVKTICNFPRPEDFLLKPLEKKYDLVYIGSISSQRGILETLQAIEGTAIRYALAGDFQGIDFESQIRQLPAWQENTTYFGFMEDMLAITTIIAQSRIGMNNVRPNANLATTISIKMFEYMAAGIPQISTNFPFWQSIIDQHQCGICIDPTDPVLLKESIHYLLNNESITQEMGRKGQEAIARAYNWPKEEAKLLDIYQKLS